CSFHRLSKVRPSPSINIGSATVSNRVLESYTAMNIGTGVDDADTRFKVSSSTHSSVGNM
ncbi:MAG: hypothetical protein ACK458_13010, partial [Sphingobacteriales bacterium]